MYYYVISHYAIRIPKLHSCMLIKFAEVDKRSNIQCIMTLTLTDMNATQTPILYADVQCYSAIENGEFSPPCAVMHFFPRKHRVPGREICTSFVRNLIAKKYFLHTLTKPEVDEHPSGWEHKHNVM